jgi:hypothetical protein
MVVVICSTNSLGGIVIGKAVAASDDWSQSEMWSEPFVS